MPPHCRLRAHEAVLRRKHEAALDNLQSAAGHCENAGGAQNLNAVADFIRSEISDHFRLHDPDEGQASWLSRGAAGALMLGKHAPDAYHYVIAPKLGCGASADTEEAKSTPRGSGQGPLPAASRLGSHHAL